MSTKKNTGYAGGEFTAKPEAALLDKSKVGNRRLPVEVERYIDMKMKELSQHCKVVPAMRGNTLHSTASASINETKLAEDRKWARSYFGIDAVSTGEPTTQFHSMTSETMSHISDLSMIVDNIIEQLSPVLIPSTPEVAPTNPLPPTVSSELSEFFERANNKIDSLRERLAHAMVRLTI